MLLELIILASGSLLLAAPILVAIFIIRDKWTLARFKKLSNGLPMYPVAGWIGNHTSTVMFGKQNCESLRKAHDEMGNTIGFITGNRFCASTTDLDLIKAVIQDEPDVHMSRSYQEFSPIEEFQKSIMLVPAEEWRTVRRAIAPAFAKSKFSTPNVQGQIEQSIGKLTDAIDRRLTSAKSKGELVEVDTLTQKFSIDLVFNFFYKRDKLIDYDDPHDFWTEKLEQGFVDLQSNPLAALAVSIPFLGRVIDWFVWNFTDMGYCRQKICDFINKNAKLGIDARNELKELTRHAKETSNKFDANDFTLKDGREFKRYMVDHVIDQYLDGRLTTSQYMNNSTFLSAAAHRTASDCLTHTIYLLATNQDIQDKLRESIASEGTESEYLDWVLKESLRLLPPAPVGCSRIIERDIEIEGGYVLPRGTWLATCAYVIHHLKEYWGEDADEFRPERWRDTSKHHPMQFLAFGAGPRGCAGKALAMHEMKMLFSVLLTRYKFEGEPRDDAYVFDAPCFIYVLPNSPTLVKIQQL